MSHVLICFDIALTSTGRYQKLPTSTIVDMTGIYVTWGRLFQPLGKLIVKLYVCLCLI